MKKSFIIVGIITSIFVVGTFSVSAITSTLVKKVSNFYIESGTVKSITNISAPYNFAQIQLNVNSLNGTGKNKNYFLFKLVEGGTAKLKYTVPITLTQYTCSMTDVGYMKAGKWQVDDNAVYPGSSTKYKGWSGQIDIFSYTHA